MGSCALELLQNAGAWSEVSFGGLGLIRYIGLRLRVIVLGFRALGFWGLEVLRFEASARAELGTEMYALTYP